MQHVQRHLVADGFEIPRPSQGEVIIRSPGGEEIARQPLAWGPQGTAISQWRIPADAPLGHYTVEVADSEDGKYSAHFQVEEFRTPSFEAVFSGETQWQTSQQWLNLSMSLHFRAGGGAGGEAVRFNGLLEESNPAPLPDFSFLDERLPRRAPPAVTPMSVRMDAMGQAQLSWLAPSLDRPYTLRGEMQFTDPSGEAQTVGKRFSLWPSPIKLGVRAVPVPAAPDKASVAPSARLEAVALSAENQPVPKLAMRLLAQAVRHRYGRPLELLGVPRTVCEGESDGQGRLRCTWGDEPPLAAQEAPLNDWLFIAEAATGPDAPGPAISPSSVRLPAYRFQWAEPPTREKDVIALEKGQSQPLKAGEPARLRIRTPFVPATLLLTVEREGILQASVHPIQQAISTVELPLPAAFAPNVHVSAYFARGPHAIATDVPPEDTGSGRRHSLRVAISPDQFALKVELQAQRTHTSPGSTVPVRIRATQLMGGQAAAHARATMVVVDEGLLALKRNPSWALLDALMVERRDWVQPVHLKPGWSHAPRFGPWPRYRGDDEVEGNLFSPSLEIPPPLVALMAAPSVVSNADGAAPVRSDFSSLALWRTDVQLDAQGEVVVQVPFNDSLTRWRVVALVMEGADRFGHGQTQIDVGQALQLYGGFPEVLRSGDRITQAVTLRNTGSQPLTLGFSATARAVSAAGSENSQPPGACPPLLPRVECKSPAATDPAANGLSQQRQLRLEPGQAQRVAWPVLVPEGVERLEWDIRADSDPSGESDRIRLSQKVEPALPVTVRQANLLALRGPTELPLIQPDAQDLQRPHLQVALSESLVTAALPEVRRWMASYPYQCLEQQANQHISSGNRAAWAALMNKLPDYLDDRGLARYFAEHHLQGSEMLSALLLDLSHASGWPVPAESRKRLLQGLKQALAMDEPAEWAPHRDSTSQLARRLGLQATLVTQGELRSLQALRVRPADLSTLPTIALVDWGRTLLTLPADGSTKAELERVAHQLTQRFSMQGTQLNWVRDTRDEWWWWMWNGDVAMARTLLLLQDWQAREPKWRAWSGRDRDPPRLTWRDSRTPPH
jgi:uncharacterized protein YfaS (alpha-2-macroglobulin family)